ncbi:ABC transporter permease [Actinomyces procaprae]|uniref:ABC transporter permease n=1 Tax=Actinomyces procaprae TaxID=2560010 RepID=UPI001F00C478|nr:Tat pathway signal protein [Actinomyces procaprae]
MTTRAERRPVRMRAAPRPQATAPLHGLRPTVHLLWRRLRWQVLAWCLPPWLLAALTPPAYERVYPSPQTRELLVQSMRDTPGTRLLYGVLPLPGRIGQLVQWETGTYLLFCVSLMAVLLVTRTMRADEEDGLVEVQHAAGVGWAIPFAAPLLVCTGAVAGFGLGVGLVLTGVARFVTEMTVVGAWMLAGAVAVTGWAFIGLTALDCQLYRRASQARLLALVTLTVGFALRVAADELGAAWLRWLTPLGWRDLAAPYTDDDPMPLALCAATCVALVAAAGALYAHREYADGYLPDRATSGRRWRIHGYADLLTRLSTRTTLAWAAAVTSFSALFGAMAGNLTGLLKPGSATGSYVGKMAAGSPVQQYLSLLTIMTVLLVAVAAVQRINVVVLEERFGLIDVDYAVGLSRTRLFVVLGGVAAVEAFGLLVLSGGVLAAATGSQLAEDHAVGRAFVFTVSQLPGALAAIGIALAVVGVAPRRFGLVWAVLAWSAFARLLGGMMDLPTWAQDLSVLGHYLDVVGDPDWVPLAVQTAVGVLGTAVGLVAYRRRDLSGV